MWTFMRCAVAGLCVAVSLARLALAADEPTGLAGQWKLVLSPFTDTEMMILKVQTEDGRLDITTVHTGPQFSGWEAKQIQQQGDRVTLEFARNSTSEEFTGTLAKEGPRAGQVLGTATFSGRTYAARLEKTEANEVGRAAMPKGFDSYIAAMRERDPKEKVAKLQQAAEAMDAPAAANAYQQILQNAESAELSSDQVKHIIEKLIAIGKPYGETLVMQYRIAALKGLSGKEDYAGISLELAQQTEKLLTDDSPLEQQSDVLAAYVSAARLAGKKDLADQAEQRLAKIETELDEEYHRTVPPFKPEPFKGRTDPQQDRVVLMELFTGAQCPPCVAADVAFDALLKTYKPTELVTLQYHLHIPGPDPLTNPDAESRARYYMVRGTPSTYFNGAAAAGGGGGMANAESKYAEYREVIDEQLAGQKQATIDVKANRSGQKIVITATAQATSLDEEKEEEKEPRLRLRLVLTEESIRYVGGNRLRFHHHVVRGFPGGVDGKELVAGQVTVEETIDLTELKKDLAEYLKQYAKDRPFPNPLPELQLENLSVVAFVQNDADKRILHAVAIPVR